MIRMGCSLWASSKYDSYKYSCVYLFDEVIGMKLNIKHVYFSCRHISFESFEVVFPYDYNFAECFEEVVALPDINCIYHTGSYIDICMYISCVIKALTSVFVL